MLVIYVIVLLAHRSLGTFFKFVLTVTGTGVKNEMTAKECDLHLYETVVPQNGHQLVQFLGLKPHATGQIVIFETVVHNMSREVARKIMVTFSRSSGCSMSLLCKYLHRVPSKLVQDDDILWLVKSTCDVLNEETECLLFFLRGHPNTPPHHYERPKTHFCAQMSCKCWPCVQWGARKQGRKTSRVGLENIDLMIQSVAYVRWSHTL